MNNDTNDVLQDDIRQAFHTWKHEDVITKIIFKYLRSKLDEATTTLQNNAFSEQSQDIKVKNYYICAAKIQCINEILSLTLTDIEDLRNQS